MCPLIPNAFQILLQRLSTKYQNTQSKLYVSKKGEVLFNVRVSAKKEERSEERREKMKKMHKMNYFIACQNSRAFYPRFYRALYAICVDYVIGVIWAEDHREIIGNEMKREREKIERIKRARTQNPRQNLWKSDKTISRAISAAR